MIRKSGQDIFRSCLQNFLSGARKNNKKEMSKPVSKIFLRTVPLPVQKMLSYLYWNKFHEKESATLHQHTVSGIDCIGQKWGDRNIVNFRCAANRIEHSSAVKNDGSAGVLDFIANHRSPDLSQACVFVAKRALYH